MTCNVNLQEDIDDELEVEAIRFAVAEKIGNLDDVSFFSFVNLNENNVAKYNSRWFHGTTLSMNLLSIPGWQRRSHCFKGGSGKIRKLWRCKYWFVIITKNTMNETTFIVRRYDSCHRNDCVYFKHFMVLWDSCPREVLYWLKTKNWLQSVFSTK